VSDIWNGFRNIFVEALELLHTAFRFLGDEPAWGWAIIALTLVVRIILLPLAIKQTRSMRATQQLQPQIKAIQKKYKVDRELLRKDPEQYKAKRAKMNEELQALYGEAGVNPIGGCLPLIAQAPIFIALFSVLRTPISSAEPGTTLGNLVRADFYFFTPDATGLSTAASSAGVAGIALIVLMAASMFWSQRQMMARNAANADKQQQQQQKILMYAMPVFLAFISFGFPMGVLLYWATTNVWQIAQQAVILREVQDDSAGTASPKGRGGSGGSSNGRPTNPTTRPGKGTKASPPPSGKKGKPSTEPPTSPRGPRAGSGGAGRDSAKRSNSRPASSSHLPDRRSRGDKK
jgi:YidC/Oxa1 family membrane protein insertase